MHAFYFNTVTHQKRVSLYFNIFQSELKKKYVTNKPRIFFPREGVSGHTFRFASLTKVHNCLIGFIINMSNIYHFSMRKGL